MNAYFLLFSNIETKMYFNLHAFTLMPPLPVCFYNEVPLLVYFNTKVPLVCFYNEVPFTCMLFPWDPFYLYAFTKRFPLPVCFLRSSGWEPVVTEAPSTVHPLCWYSPPAPPGSLSRCFSWPYPSSKSTPDGQTVTNSSLQMFKMTVDGRPNIIWLCLQWYGAKVVVSMINYQMTMI